MVRLLYLTFAILLIILCVYTLCGLVISICSVLCLYFPCDVNDDCLLCLSRDSFEVINPVLFVSSFLFPCVFFYYFPIFIFFSFPAPCLMCFRCLCWSNPFLSSPMSVFFISYDFVSFLLISLFPVYSCISYFPYLLRMFHCVFLQLRLPGFVFELRLWRVPVVMLIIPLNWCSRPFCAGVTFSLRVLVI